MTTATETVTVETTNGNIDLAINVIDPNQQQDPVSITSVTVTDNQGDTPVQTPAADYANGVILQISEDGLKLDSVAVVAEAGATYALAQGGEAVLTDKGNGSFTALAAGNTSIVVSAAGKADVTIPGNSNQGNERGGWPGYGSEWHGKRGCNPLLPVRMQP